MEFLLAPLGLLNLIGGVVGSVWLIALGNWLVVGIGIFIAIPGIWIVRVLLVPGMSLFGSPSAVLADRGNNWGALVLIFLLAVYISALLVVWCMGSLYVLSNVSGGHSKSAVTIFAYGSATSAWAYKAQKDSNSRGLNMTDLSLLFAEIAFVVVGLMNIYGRQPFQALLSIFVIFMAFAVVVNVFTARSKLRASSQA